MKILSILVGLWVRHSAKSSIAQEELQAASHYLVTSLHLPHAIVVRLHAHLINVVSILTLATVSTVGV